MYLFGWWLAQLGLDLLVLGKGLGHLAHVTRCADCLSELVGDTLEQRLGKNLDSKTHVNVGVGGLFVWFSILVKESGLDHGFLERCLWSHAPLAGVDVTLHNDALDLGDNAVVASGHNGRRHLSNGQANGLTLGRTDNNLLIDLNSVFVSENTGQHNFSTVANGIHSGIL